MNQPIFGMMLGIWEIILIFLVLIVMAALVGGVVFFAIWLSRRNSSKPAPSPAANSPKPTPPPTAKMCSSCGALLSPDSPQGLCPACLMKVAMGSESGNPGASTEKKPAPPPAEIAKHFPHLEILELLGQGGMGMVYKARQLQLDRIVALKILPLEAARDAAFAERFAREARALAKLNHPNIVSVYDFGQSGAFFYFLMEFVDGVNLRQMQQTRRLTPGEALQIVPRICEALQYAHDEGIVHRDIKPENILIDKKGRVKIADFGLAKLLGQAPQDFRLTGSAHIMGTPHYMAPEQLERPLEVDHRADIYSLGVVFYEMLTGELPLGRFAAPSQKVQVDVRLDEVVLKTLEKEPQRRYQQASEIKTRVETISNTENSGAAPALKSERTAVAAEQTFSPRFSRTAIVGAVWAPFFFIAFVAAYFTIRVVAVEPGQPPVRAWWQWLALFTLLPLGLTAPFGTTILGCVAIAQIRHSAGRLYGLGLAVMDALLFPLLVVNGILIGGYNWLARDLGRALIPKIGHPLFNVIWLLLMAASCGIVSWLIVRAVWRAANKPAEDSHSHPGAEKKSGWRFATALLVVAGILIFALAGFAAWTTWEAMRRPAQRRATLMQWTQPDVLVKGTVTDAETNEPLDGVRVADIFYNRGPERPVRAFWTDTNGYFEFRTWNEGNHVLNFSLGGYDAADLKYRVQPAGAREYHVQFILKKQKPPVAENPSVASATNAISPAANAVTEAQRDVFRAKVAAAADALELAEKEFATGQITEAELIAARDELAICEAELAGDPVQVERAKLTATQHQLDAVKAQVEAGLAAAAEQQAAQRALEMQLAELRLAQATSQTTAVKAVIIERPSRDEPRDRREPVDVATIAEVDAAMKLNFDNSRTEALKAIAKRAGLSPSAQAHLATQAMTRLDFENNRVEVLRALISNPDFSEAGRLAIVNNLNHFWFDSNRRDILRALDQRGPTGPASKRKQYMP